MDLIGIDLFSGAGGMSIGAEAAGLTIRSAVEANRHAAATYALNHPSVSVHARDIREITPEGLDGLNEEPFVIFGGPPCQGFSTSNQRTRTSKNPTNWLFDEYLRFVRVLRPEWVVFENVKGIAETESGFFFKAVLTGLQDLGYKTTHWTLNAADYGVPQKRWRIFVVGSHKGYSLREPTRAKGTTPTLKDAIEDLPVLANGASRDFRPYRKQVASQYAQTLRTLEGECGNHLVTRNSDLIIERYTAIPAGANWASIPEELMQNYKDRHRCHTGIYRRLHYNEPSVVIGNFRKNMLIHPTQNRGLSVREAARIQSFHDGFRFCGSIGFQQQQVGNAVPPLLAQAVFEAITSVL